MPSTVLQNGVTTAKRNSTLSQSRLPDPTRVHRYFNDFDNLVSGDWLSEATGGSSPTLTLAQKNGGAAVITLDATAGIDFAAYYLATSTSLGSSFALATNTGAAIKCKIAIDDLTNTGFFVGLRKVIATIPTTLGASDKAFGFYKVQGSTTINFVQQNTATPATVSIGTTTSLGITANTDVILGASYDPDTSTTSIFVNDTKVTSLGPSNVGNIPTGLMAPIMCAQQPSGSTGHTLTVDYILCEVNRDTYPAA